MKLKKMVFIVLGLALITGLVLVNMGLCQQGKPGDTTGQAAAPATEGGKKPAAKGKAKASEKQQAPGKAAVAPAAPEKTADPGKLPGKFVPSEGC